MLKAIVNINKTLYFFILYPLISFLYSDKIYFINYINYHICYHFDWSSELNHTTIYYQNHVDLDILD